MPSLSRLMSAFALLLVAAIVAPASAQGTSPGWMYTINMSTDSGGKRSSMAMKYQVTARKLRLEFVQVSGMGGASTAEGMAQILDDADSSMTMMMPAQHTAMVMHLNEMLGNMPGMRTGMTPKIVSHVTSSSTEDLGAGERILGHATHRYRVTTAGTMDLTLMGRTCTRTIDAVTDRWMATDVDLLPAMMTMVKHFQSVAGLGDVFGDVSGHSTSELKGTALRTVSRTTATDAKGKVVPVTSTAEYVEMSQAPIAASVFAVPADYQTMDMRKMMADMPAGMMDSAMAKAGAQQQEHSANTLCGGAAKP